mmetsp:Transcript_3839/g.9611  ORF Transcript_3839/g.9611 Transcript_3839/m.9611 type:complete len:289 (-) Transcript_3839:400-1266(-)
MMILPLSYHSPRISSRRRKRSDSGRISTICVMSELTTDLPPTWISTGLSSTLRASVSTERGNVALNMTVCLSGRMLLTMRMIWGSNPMSNMRSASSMTRYVTRLRFVILPLDVTSRSIMRPGVHATTSTPLFSSEIWLATPLPPNTAVHSIPMGLANFLISLLICCTSSRVGAMMRAMGPSPWARGGWSLTCRSMGSTNASVLPLPVLAMPMQSRPLMMQGRACAWMGRGAVQPSLRSSSSIFVLRPHCVHALMGLGMSDPRTLMPSSSFLSAVTSSADILTSSGTSV